MIAHVGDEVKRPRRRDYDASGRASRSAARRQRIIASAGSLIIERGYRATTVAAIAERADVHVDTVYELVGRKSDLLRELIERALSGVDRPVPAAERDYVAAIRGEPEPARKIEIYAAATRAMLERLAPLFVALRDAAGTDATARSLWQEFSTRRATNMREFVADVAGAGGLRNDLSIDVAADTVWATNSPELYVMLTGERGWSSTRYEAWLADLWRHVLLPPAGTGSGVADVGDP
jgi:AcrR family transcriptional regulator